MDGDGEKTRATRTRRATSLIEELNEHLDGDWKDKKSDMYKKMEQSKTNEKGSREYL